MNFNVGLYPLYGIMLGGNWSKTEYLDEEYTEYKIQLAIFIILVEFTW